MKKIRIKETGVVDSFDDYTADQLIRDGEAERVSDEAIDDTPSGATAAPRPEDDETEAEAEVEAPIDEPEGDE